MAARQGGVVSLAQLLAAGLGEGAVRRRVHCGRLVRLHRGVYAVGHAQFDVSTPHERVVHRAQHLRVLDTHAINEQLARAQGRRTKPLIAALERLQATDPDVTRSELEERFLNLILTAQLPRPRANARVGPYEVDFLWPDHHLIVETDGAATHAPPQAFEDDRQRDAELAARGDRVLRFTWRQIVYEPDSVLRAVSATLGG